MWQSACKQPIEDEEGSGKTERSRSDQERGGAYGQRRLRNLLKLKEGTR
jgi:hypothetical protein